MNEKQFLKNAISNEHGTKVLDLSAEDILSARVKSGGMVRSRGFAGAAVLAAAAVTAGGVYLLAGTSADVNTADAPVSQPKDTQLTTTTEIAGTHYVTVTDSDEKTQMIISTTLPDGTTATTTVSDKSKPLETTTADRGDIHYPAQTPFDDGSGIPTETSDMIESYPISERYSYDVPEIGEVIMSVPLTQAIEAYGADTRYRVVVEVFDSKGRIADRDAVIAEEERLAALGYVAPYEEYSDGATIKGWLTLHATAQQIKELAKDKDHGYFIYLYGEIDFMEAQYGAEE